MHLTLELRSSLQRRRQHQSTSNTFVKLHPRQVSQLYHEALECSTNRKSHIVEDNGDHRHCRRRSNHWHIRQENPSNVLFLPLKISFIAASNGTTSTEHDMYVSYNGGQLDKENVIELNECLIDKDTLQELKSSHELVYVDVQPIHMVKNAESVILEPLSTNDWELVEIFAGQIEAGLLLSQVSIVYPNQILPLQLRSDVVHLRVIGQSFESSSSSETGHDCLRLVAQSEVIISPKPRGEVAKSEKKDEEGIIYSVSDPFRVLPAEADFSKDMKSLLDMFNTFSSTMTRLLPAPPLFCGFMHPETLSQRVDGWDDIHIENEDGSNIKFIYVSLWKSQLGSDFNQQSIHKPSAVAKILSREEIPVDCIVLDPYIRLQLHVAPLLNFVRIHVMTTSQIERKLKPSQNGGQLPLRIISLRLRRERSGSIWNFPEEYTSASFSSYKLDPLSSNISTGRLCSAKVVDACPDALLSCGSVIPYVNASSPTLFKVTLDENAREELNNVRSGDDEQFLVFAQEVMALLQNSNELMNECQDIQAPNDYMLNILPNSYQLATCVLQGIETCCSHLQAGKDMVILEGDRGNGRTFFTLILAAKLRMMNNVSSFYLDCRQLQSSISHMDQLLQEVCNFVHWSFTTKPSLLILDNFDELIPNLEEHDRDEEFKPNDNPGLSNQVKAISDQICFLLQGLQSHKRQFSTIVTCQKHINFNDKLAHFDSINMTVPILGGIDRVNLLAQLLMNEIDNDAFAGPTAVEKLVSISERYSPYDLKCIAEVIKKKVHGCWNNTKNVGKKIHTGDIVEAFSKHIPSCYKSLNVAEAEPELRWSEVGGLLKATQKLYESILQPIKYNKIYASLPISLPKGILLFGPPGCGKTAIVPAIAKECGYNLITCRGPEVFDKYIGKSEAKVRELFDTAYEASPSILFFDEFDSLAPRRGIDNTGVTDRVVNQLLTYLDGVEVQGEKDVYIIAASSRPDKIDPALLRPGRLENHIYIGFPDNLPEWMDLFTKMSMKRDLHNSLKQSVLDKSFMHHLNKLNCSLLSYSAADIKGIYDTAHLNAVHEHINKKTTGTITSSDEDVIFITSEHLEKAFSSTRPSLPHSDRLMLAKCYLPFIGSDIHNSECKRSLGLSPADDFQVMDELRQQKTALK